MPFAISATLCKPRRTKPAGIMAFSTQRWVSPPGSADCSSITYACCTYLIENQMASAEIARHRTAAARFTIACVRGE